MQESSLEVESNESVPEEPLPALSEIVAKMPQWPLAVPRGQGRAAAFCVALFNSRLMQVLIPHWQRMSSEAEIAE